MHTEVNANYKIEEKKLTRLNDMAIGKNNTTAFIDDETGSGARISGFGVEKARTGDSENNDGGNYFPKTLPPVIGSYSVFLTRRRIDFYAQIIHLSGSAGGF